MFPNKASDQEAEEKSSAGNVGPSGDNVGPCGDKVGTSEDNVGPSGDNVGPSEDKVGQSEEDDVEYEPINVTVIDDNGKARIQTNPIKGLTKLSQPAVDILADGIQITAEVTDRSDPSRTTTHRSRIPLIKDISKDCQIHKKEVTDEGRLVIQIKKNSDFKLARLVRARKAQFTVEESK